MLDITYCLRPLPVDKRLPGNRALVPTVLTEEGHRVEVVPDGDLHVRRSDILWMQGNPCWFPKARRRLASLSRAERPFVVCWHSEPLPPPKASGLPRPRLDLREIAKILLRRVGTTDVYSNHACLRRLGREGIPDLLVSSARARQEFLAENGIESEWVPFGFHPSLGHDMGLERDIDALTLGAQTIARRNRQIERLRRLGVDVVVKGSWSDPSCWGESRTELLNRTKILVNIQRYVGDQSHVRLLLAGANRALLVSEPMYDPAPFEAGRHFVSATIEEMPDAIAHYLEHDEERRAIVDENERFVTEELTMRRSVARIVDLIENHRRRGVEAEG